MSKRKQLELEFNYLTKRCKEMKEKMESLEVEDEDSMSGEGSASDDEDKRAALNLSFESETKEEEDADTANETGEQQQVNEPNDSENAEKENQKQQEKPLNDLLMSALGEDPRESKALKLAVHSNLAGRYAFIAANGLKKEDIEALLNKYETADQLKAPALNEQIRAKLGEKTLRRDVYKLETQKLIGLSLSVLSSAITMINDADEEGIDQEEFLERLADSAKIMAEAQYRQSESRRAFIIPRFDKQVQEILKKSKPDTLLFGKDLPNKIKEFKESERLFKESNQPQKSNAEDFRNSGNSRRPFHQKPPFNRQANTFTSEQGRRKLLFKPRKQGPRKYPNAKQKKFNNNNKQN